MDNWTTEFVPGTPRIAFDSAGKGPLVVFLHGIGGNRSNWHDQLPAVAGAGFRAVAWDARGYGLSDDYAGPLDFADFSTDLARLIQHLATDKAHFVGLSMGGRILQDFYPRFPELVHTLTLCCTFPGFDGTFSDEKRDEFVRLRTAPLLAGKEPADMAPMVANTLLGPEATTLHRQRLLDSMAALHKESYIKTVEATTHYDKSADLSAIAVPTLLVFAEQDRLTTPKIGVRMAEKIRNSRLEVIANAGHLVNIEFPQIFNALILDFLRSNPMGQRYDV